MTPALRFAAVAAVSVVLGWVVFQRLKAPTVTAQALVPGAMAGKPKLEPVRGNASRPTETAAPRAGVVTRNDPAAGSKRQRYAASRPFEPGPSMAEWDELLNARCPANLADFVGGQLAQWEPHGINETMLDGLYCIRKQVARVSIHKGELRQTNWQLTMDHNRLRSAFWLLQLALWRGEQRGDPLPDVEFIVNPTDKTAKFASGRQQGNAKGKLLRQTPLFCNVKCKGDASISFPLYYHTLYGLPDGAMSLPLYQNKRVALKSMGASTTWDEKTPRLFFSATNKRGNRAKVFGLKSDMIEAVTRNVPLSTYGQYRYQVYTYGHSGWSRRLRELAYMNSTVMMERSECEEFFFHGFKEGVHYQSVAEDLSDLAEKLAAAAGAEADSRAMAARWVELGPQLLSLECILDYIEATLRGYARLQRFAPRPQPGWPLHHVNSSARYFLESQPPSIEMCAAHF